MASIPLPRDIEAVLARFDAQGIKAYLAGGCVRDALMGKEPGDYDIACASTPAQTAALFAKHRVLPTGIAHGTVTLLTTERAVEITTFRSDGAYSDARRPDSVHFEADIESDLARRDFTINAMAYHPKTGLIDLFGGQDDLAQRIIRCVGDPNKRFGEDALRILRALRFASVLGFSIEGDTARGMMACKETLRHISAERIAVEWVKFLLGDCKRLLLDFHQVIGVFVPEWSACIGFAQHSVHHDYTVAEHIANAVAAIAPKKELRLAMFFHDIAKPVCFSLGEDGAGHFYGHEKMSAAMTRDILTRLRFDKATREAVTTLVFRHGLSLPSQDALLKRWLGRLGEETFFQLLRVRRADVMAQRSVPDSTRLCVVDAVASQARAILAKGQCLGLKDLTIGGRELLAAGFLPGPMLGETLHTLLGLVIDEKLPNEPDALLQKAKQLKEDC